MRDARKPDDVPQKHGLAERHRALSRPLIASAVSGAAEGVNGALSSPSAGGEGLGNGLLILCGAVSIQVLCTPEARKKFG